VSEYIYEVCRTKNSNASYNLVSKNGQELVTKNIQVIYRVHVTGTSVTVPSDVDEEMVRNAPSATGATFDQRIPKVGETNYESPDGKIYPWWRCTSVNVSRNSSNGYEFTVTANFVDDTGKETGIDPPNAVTDIAPVINYSFQEYEVTAWTEDETAKGSAAQPKPCVLPTGTLYSNPPVKVTGQEIVTFSQYEVGFDVASILGDGTAPGRLYAVNKDNFYIDTTLGPQYPNTVNSRHAMITDIAFEEASVLLSGGYAACQRVTYTIGVRRYKVKSLQDDGSFVEISPGWDQPRVRADTRCKSDTGEVGPAANIESWGNQQTYLKGDGADAGKPHAKAQQYGIPPYDLLKLQPEIYFASTAGGFLR
jgi:hypothetical protein